MVRYADDAVLGFQHREDAEAFLEQLRERMRKFGLELHAEKTRMPPKPAGTPVWAIRGGQTEAEKGRET